MRLQSPTKGIALIREHRVSAATLVPFHLTTLLETAAAVPEP